MLAEIEEPDVPNDEVSTLRPLALTRAYFYFCLIFRFMLINLEKRRVLSSLLPHYDANKVSLTQIP